MNTELLKQIAKHIQEEPKRLDMNNIAYEVEPTAEGAPKCGTVGCIAGWACLLKGMPAYEADWDEGKKLLKLTEDEADRLFSEPRKALAQVGDEDTERFKPDVWPLRFARRYDHALTPRGRAKATVARIEHFIKTKGRE